MTKIVICGVAGRMGQRLAHLTLTAVTWNCVAARSAGTTRLWGATSARSSVPDIWT